MYGRFAMLDNPGAYLRVTVVNVVREGHRRCELERRHLLRLDPSATTVSAKTHHLVDVLGGLPLRQRSVLVLRYWADWPDTQIAEALRCRPGTVRSLAARGLRAVSKELS
jgi:RNA polymerase sigma factor (sigma-70 family)